MIGDAAGERLRPVRPRPTASVRPWAGTRLAPVGWAGPRRTGGDADMGVGELWVAGPDCVVGSDGSDWTLDRLARTHGAAFVGRRAMERSGARFPLLVKLIDAADRLSLQVHPSDELAVELHGPDAVGKTEAWLVVEAGPGAELVVGPHPEMSEGRLLAAVAEGTMGIADCEVVPATPGDILLVRAGTIHAIGAGTLVYEIEQPSDLTYRISDWGRPPVPGRALHREEALRAIRPELRAETSGRDWRPDGGALEVPEFRLEVCAEGPAERRPAAESVEVVTVLRGEATATGDGWSETLVPFETLVVPASVERYAIEGGPGSIGCVGSIP